MNPVGVVPGLAAGQRPVPLVHRAAVRNASFFSRDAPGWATRRAGLRVRPCAKGEASAGTGASLALPAAAVAVAGARAAVHTRLVASSGKVPVPPPRCQGGSA